MDVTLFEIHHITVIFNSRIYCTWDTVAILWRSSLVWNGQLREWAEESHKSLVIDYF